MAIPPRLSLRSQGLAAVGTGVVLVGAGLPAGTAGSAALAVPLFVLQALLVLGFLALVEAPASSGAVVVAGLAAVCCDVLAVAGRGRTGPFAGVVGLAVVASLLHQLARRNRSRVTESLADTLVAVALVVGAACLLTLHQHVGGGPAVRVGLAAATAALLAGRCGDALAPRPPLAVGATRGWPGLVLAAGAAALAGVAAGGGLVVGSRAALLGVVAGLAAAAADVAVDVGGAELTSHPRDARRASALRPVGALLPFAAVGPVALVAARLVLP